MSQLTGVILVCKDLITKHFFGSFFVRFEESIKLYSFFLMFPFTKKCSFCIRVDGREEIFIDIDASYTSEQMHEWISYERKIFLWYLIGCILNACFEIDEQISHGLVVPIVSGNEEIIDFFMQEHTVSFSVPVEEVTHQAIFQFLLAPSEKASK